MAGALRDHTCSCWLAGLVWRFRLMDLHSTSKIVSAGCWRSSWFSWRTIVLRRAGPHTCLALSLSGGCQVCNLGSRLRASWTRMHVCVSPIERHLLQRRRRSVQFRRHPHQRGVRACPSGCLAAHRLRTPWDPATQKLRWSPSVSAV